MKAAFHIAFCIIDVDCHKSFVLEDYCFREHCDVIAFMQDVQDGVDFI